MSHCRCLLSKQNPGLFFFTLLILYLGLRIKSRFSWSAISHCMFLNPGSTYLFTPLTITSEWIQHATTLNNGLFHDFTSVREKSSAIVIFYSLLNIFSIFKVFSNYYPTYPLIFHPCWSADFCDVQCFSVCLYWAVFVKCWYFLVFTCSESAALFSFQLDVSC